MKRQLTLDKSQADRVEHQIRPPMALAISIPVQGVLGGAVVVYVSLSPFGASGPPDLEDIRILTDIARRLRLE